MEIVNENNIVDVITEGGDLEIFTQPQQVEIETGGQGPAGPQGPSGSSLVLTSITGNIVVDDANRSKLFLNNTNADLQAQFEEVTPGEAFGFVNNAGGSIEIIPAAGVQIKWGSDLTEVDVGSIKSFSDGIIYIYSLTATILIINGQPTGDWRILP